MKIRRPSEFIAALRSSRRMQVSWGLILICWVLIAILWGQIGYAMLFAECGWFAPKEVEFHQGMTLCPGQSARMEIRIPINVDRKDNGI